MTQAQRFINAWYSKTKTSPSLKVAQSIEADVGLEVHFRPFRQTFTFSDGSRAFTQGRGGGFTIGILQADGTQLPIMRPPQ